jgi:hypothetical protein
MRSSRLYVVFRCKFSSSAVLVLLLLLGLSFLNVYDAVIDATKGGHLDLSSAVSMLKVSAWCAFVGGIAIW